MKTRISPKFSARVSAPTLAAILCLMLSGVAPAQSVSSADRDRGRTMLRDMKEDIKKYYYDSSYHGVDIDARFKAAEEKMKTATSLGQVFGIIAQAMVDLNDSHTFFLPPSRITRTEYGWQMQMVGDRCFVTAVKPGSDAEAKGLKVGDEIVSVDNFGPTRDNFWKLQYLYYTLNPKPGVRVVAVSPDGKERELELLAKVRQMKQTLDLTLRDGGNDFFNIIREAADENRLNRHRYYEPGDEVFIWKMPRFDLSEVEVDEMMGKVRNHQALILDLRGNGGGLVLTLQRLVGHFFDRDVKIADLKGRKEMKPITAKTRGDKVFKGRVVVLVDSRSGSASEVFARVMQLEKRGTVLGDRSAGAVMVSRQRPHQIGIDVVSIYHSSVTEADAIMSDGKSLERVGVTPDEPVLPTAADMAALRDPVMARAAELVGFKLDPAKAGSLFPVEWAVR